MRSLFVLAALAAPILAQGPVAHVNDSVSPGTLGDGALSLDEAIRIANGTLALQQLSAAERAQITGVGVPASIEVDARRTPTITLRTPLTPIDGAPAGGAIAIRGANGRPTLDASTVTLAMRIRTNTVVVSNLGFAGGNVAVDADTSVHLDMNQRLLLDGLHFTGQTQIGVKLSAVGMMRMLPVTLSHSTFDALATAIDIDDRSNGGPVMVDVENVTFDQVQRAANIAIDATGNMTMCRMWRCKLSNSAQLAMVRRSPTSDQRLMLMVVASDLSSTGDMVDAQGTPLVETAVHVHTSTIRAAAGRRAFVLGPQDARIDFHMSENEIHGDIDVAEGRLNRRLWAWNNEFEGCALRVSNQGAPTSFRWNRFENCTIVALPGNSTPMNHTSSEFVGCTLDGQSFGGNILLENCHVDAATTTTGNVVTQSPAPSPWLARTSCSDDTPALGTSVDLTLDLPTGMLGVWQIGVSNPRVVLTQEPWRDYAFRSPNILVPGIYALRTTLRIPVPNDPNLLGAELYCWPTTAPVAGQTHVPALNLPRGAHLTITR